MKIIFLSDYKGRETAMQEYKAGSVLELDHQAALDLIRLGIAQEQHEEQPAPKKPRKVKEVTDDTN